MAIKLLRQEFIDGIKVAEVRTDETGLVTIEHIVQDAPNVSASNILVADTQGHFVGTDLETVLQELYGICE